MKGLFTSLSTLLGYIGTATSVGMKTRMIVHSDIR